MQLNGLLYSDLYDDLKESLQDYALNVHTISRHSDEDVVFEVTSQPLQSSGWISNHLDGSYGSGTLLLRSLPDAVAGGKPMFGAPVEKGVRFPGQRCIPFNLIIDFRHVLCGRIWGPTVRLGQIMGSDCAVSANPLASGE